MDQKLYSYNIYIYISRDTRCICHEIIKNISENLIAYTGLNHYGPIGSMLASPHAAQRGFIFDDRKLAAYKEYTIEDIKNSRHFNDFEIIFLKTSVAQEYISTQDIFKEREVYRYITDNKEYIVPKSLILWFDKYGMKIRTQLYKILRILEDYPDKYIEVVIKYSDTLTGYKEIHKSVDGTCGKVRCIEESIFKHLIDKCNIECLKLLLTVCIDEDIYAYIGKFGDSLFFRDSCRNMEKYMEYLLTHKSILEEDMLMRVLLSLGGNITREALMVTLEISPIKFKILLKYCDDTEGLENELRDKQAFYYML